MKTFLLIFSIFILNCKTTDILATATTDSDWEDLQTIEIEFANFFELKKFDSLKNVEEILKSTENKTVLNNKYLAKIECYKILLSIAKTNSVNKKKLAIARELNKKEPLLKIIETMTLKHSEKTEKLENALSQNSTSLLIKTFLANNYLKTRKYSQAITLYDQLASKNFNYQLTTFFRQKSLTLKQIEKTDNTDFTFDNITYKNLLTMLNKEKMLDFLLTQEPASIFIELQSKNYIPLTSYFDEQLNRKNFAKLLANIICENEFKIEKLEKIRKYYENKFSPIQDIKSEEYFFAEAVYLIENDLMELPDGTRFFPEEKITQEDISKILTK